ncbi:S41 family peptidase [Ramlibacter sp. MMS24-I3-19]|uniref:S41 family peptidase n=1 Tax=Ramlibacter sp. MMS24-I3-19 TaxID=3416606 RepID=UPI003D069227
MKVRRLVAVAALALHALLQASAQSAPASPELGTPREIVATVISRVKEHYVFPKIAAQVEVALRKTPRSNRNIRNSDEARAFAQELTGELQAVAHDKHLWVYYSEAVLPQRTVAEPTDEEEATLRDQAQRSNYGVVRAEHLAGNIGYIDLRAFAPLPWAAETLAASMTLVANADALIVDLRNNGGGDPSTVAFLSSYFFETRTHLIDIYSREGDRTEQFYTLDWIPGRRFGQKKPVYLLTSSRTFSGAEEFSYNLKNLKRATIVGETTGGGANPGDVYPLNAHFQIFVPTGHAASPITHTNWEGTGVLPDVRAKAEDALDVAKMLALKGLAAAEVNSERKAQLERLQQQDSSTPNRAIVP